jgi:hypothetical protein
MTRNRPNQYIQTARAASHHESRIIEMKFTRRERNGSVNIESWVHQIALTQSRAGKKRKRYFAAAIHAEGESRKNSKINRCIWGIQAIGAMRSSNRPLHCSGTMDKI